MPPTSVSLSFSGNIINVTQESSIDLTCTTSASRPHANITWHRNNSPVARTKQTVTTSGDKFVTTSKLTIQGEVSRQGDRMHCSAINLDGQTPVTSTITTINVQCRYKYDSLVCQQLCILLEVNLFALFSNMKSDFYLDAHTIFNLI